MENNKKLTNRRQEREEAFTLVFERMFKDDDSDEVFDSAVEARDASIGEFTKLLTNGVYDNLEAIDELIEKNLKGWSKARISKVSLAILRMAVCEMKYFDKVPVGVSINEAVEICKVYGSDEDKGFVNGILGAIAREKED